MCLPIPRIPAHEHEMGACIFVTISRRRVDDCVDSTREPFGDFAYARDRLPVHLRRLRYTELVHEASPFVVRAPGVLAHSLGPFRCLHTSISYRG